MKVALASLPSCRLFKSWRKTGAVALTLMLTLGACSSADDTRELRIPGGPQSSTNAEPVSLDATIYSPANSPAPALVLAHGFGGSKADLDERARGFRDRGFVVLTYSARGFGASTGKISMNAPKFEVADARAVIDFLADQSDVTQDSVGNPRVGIAGGSYGGALALLTAGYDSRVDAIAADITWNDLESSLLGQSADVATQAPGVFKSLWAGSFFGSGVVNRDGSVTECGRFTTPWCRAYNEAAADGVVSSASRELMAASSPSSVTNRITVPTLIGAGQSDSLFPIAQANANAEQILAAHPQTPVKMVWHGGGHDGGLDESERLQEMTAGWFGSYLMGEQGSTTDFEVTDTSGGIDVQSSRAAATILQAPTYPGIHGSSQQSIPLAGSKQRVRAPAGGVPAAVTSVPGIGSRVSAVLPNSIPGQAASFDSAPLRAPLTLIGASTVNIKVAAVDAGASDEVALFASLRIVSANGRQSLPSGLVSPILLNSLGTAPQTITVELPAIVATAEAGDSLRLVVSTTDFAYRLPVQPRLYDIALAGGPLTIPQVDVQPVSTGPVAYWWLVGAAVIVLAIALLLGRLRPRRPADDSHVSTHPLVITSLTKRYNDDYLAVDDLTFTVPAGSILGLLGPNGAGKTTTMRMVMGLITPTSGAIHAFGSPVYHGAPVLARIGALVEGPGFLPHLTGRQNLDLYWRSAGRGADDPGLHEVLEIADLGTAIDKRVRTYSQGMRQRLGIAQAMLGRPDLLLLDEPTNGLDPPQIKAMRDVLRRYAESGRTVIISSHLLSEVEQTCTDVVVMLRGRLLGAGSVAELLGDTAGTRLEDVFLEIVGDDLTVGQP
ncbi:MAG: alpha/beta fold hydrolase [Actinomycetota bacterium]|nr:alpha/beta fold hydrolase [Actinomycetota bacterium]